jgi:hypothetical protein
MNRRLLFRPAGGGARNSESLPPREQQHVLINREGLEGPEKVVERGQPCALGGVRVHRLAWFTSRSRITGRRIVSQLALFRRHQVALDQVHDG